MSTKKFEYKAVFLANEINRRYSTQLSGLSMTDRMEKCIQLELEMMNELGAAGWELVLQWNSGHSIFKREIT